MSGREQLERALVTSYAGLTRTERVEPTWREAIDEIVRRVGTVTGAAREIGVHRTTLQRWRAGTIKAPTSPKLAAIRTELTELRRVVDTSQTPRVQMTLMYDGRPRNLDNENLRLDTNYLQESVGAYADGDLRSMVDRFIDAIDDPWYHDVIVDATDDYDDGYLGDVMPAVAA